MCLWNTMPPTGKSLSRCTNVQKMTVQIVKKKKKWQKLIWLVYPNHMHIFKAWSQCLQSFKSIGIKLKEELRTQGTLYPFTKMPEKMTKFKLWKKWQKIIQGLYPNHMHIFMPCPEHM